VRWRQSQTQFWQKPFKARWFACAHWIPQSYIGANSRGITQIGDFISLAKWTTGTRDGIQVWLSGPSPRFQTRSGFSRGFAITLLYSVGCDPAQGIQKSGSRDCAVAGGSPTVF